MSLLILWLLASVIIGPILGRCIAWGEDHEKRTNCKTCGALLGKDGGYPAPFPLGRGFCLKCSIKLYKHANQGES